MPVTARCKECKHILYEKGFRPNTSRVTYSFSIPKYIIRSHFDGKCPNCGRKLEFPTAKDIRISPAPGVDYIGKKKNESRRSDNNSTQKV